MTSSDINDSVADTTLPWDRFNDWLHSVCVVTFDLELGQALETIEPSHARLSAQERASVCYLAFPDSNSGCMGDTQFHFRVPRSAGAHSLTRAQLSYNEECPAAIKADASCLYGFAYFRQVKDRTLRRGYFQKSVILLSPLPFIALFTRLLQLIAPLVFDDCAGRHQGAPPVSSVCRQIDAWPPPTPATTPLLCVFQHWLQVRIPSESDKLSPIAPLVSTLTSTSASALCDSIPADNAIDAPPVGECRNIVVLPCVHEMDVSGSLQPLVAHVQLLWELVITCQPLVVMATAPSVCSGVVQALVSCIWPMRYAGDFRPFFTIHDADFRRLTQLADCQTPPAAMLGVTNPFFVKTLRRWPHILRVDALAMTNQDSVINDSVNGDIVNGGKLRKNTTHKLLETKPGLYTQYKPFLHKDKQTQRRLGRSGGASERPHEVQSTMLRRYLFELTQSFMMPLERYVASLMPLQRNISPYKAAPSMRPFNADDFCRRLHEMGPQLTSGIKGDWVGLYRRFLRCANFSEWFNTRHADITRKLQALHLEALADADVRSWVRDKQEVEMVDLALRLRRKVHEVQSAGASLPLPPNTLAKLKLRLHDVTAALPADVRSVLSPAVTLSHTPDSGQ